MLNLRYLPVNAAWAFTFGTNPETMKVISLDGEDRFFAARARAVQAADRKGLQVSRAGVVTVARMDGEDERLENPVAPEFSDEELAALAIMDGYKSFARDKHFVQAGLGPFTPENEIIRSLAAKRMVAIRGRAIVPDKERTLEVMKQHYAPAKYARHFSTWRWKQPEAKGAQPNDVVSAAEVEDLPVGSLLWGDGRGWVVVSGGIAPVTVLANGPDAPEPDGEPAQSIDASFTFIRSGEGHVLAGRMAQRYVEAWWDSERRANPVDQHGYEVPEIFDVVRDVSLALLAGAILHAGPEGKVTVGNGRLEDWRTVPSGETVAMDENAADLATLLVAMVGVEAAQAAVDEWKEKQRGGAMPAERDDERAWEEPFCACGRRMSECDGSRKACWKNQGSWRRGNPVGDTMPAKYRREGLTRRDFAYPEHFGYPLKHGPIDPDTGRPLSEQARHERTLARIRNAASRFATFGRNIPKADRPAVERAIREAAAKHDIGMASGRRGNPVLTWRDASESLRRPPGTLVSNLVNHGIKDRWGRDLGHFSMIEPTTVWNGTRYVLAEPPTWTVTTHATRDGREYGSGHHARSAPLTSLDEAKRSAERRIDDAKKRYEHELEVGTANWVPKPGEPMRPSPSARAEEETAARAARAEQRKVEKEAKLAVQARKAAGAEAAVIARREKLMTEATAKSLRLLAQLKSKTDLDETARAKAVKAISDVVEMLWKYHLTGMPFIEPEQLTHGIDAEVIRLGIGGRAVYHNGIESTIYGESWDYYVRRQKEIADAKEREARADQARADRAARESGTR